MNNIARFSFLTFAVAALLIPTFASAVTGPRELFIDKTPENVCRIIVREAQGFSVCTGTLIATASPTESDQVLTAAHCFGDDPATQVTVQCGYVGFDETTAKLEKSISGNDFYLTGALFKESSNAKVKSVSADPGKIDQAVLKLDKVFAIAPMKIGAMTTTDLQDCYMSGYGLNERLFGGLSRTGHLPALESIDAMLIAVTDVETSFAPPNDIAKKSPVNQRPLSAEEKRSLLQGTRTDTMITLIGTPGDSGAPVFCLDKQTHEPILTGIYSTTQTAAFGRTKVQTTTESKPRAQTYNWQFLMRANRPNIETIQRTP